MGSRLQPFVPLQGHSLIKSINPKSQQLIPLSVLPQPRRAPGADPGDADPAGTGWRRERRKGQSRGQSRGQEQGSGSPGIPGAKCRRPALPSGAGAATPESLGKAAGITTEQELGCFLFFGFFSQIWSQSEERLLLG